MYNKVDLHLHLDGSLDLPLSYQLAQERHLVDGITYDEFIKMSQVKDDAASLHEFLDCFRFPIAILQDVEALEKSAEQLVRNLEKQGLIYAEIRFAPQQHCQKGLSQQEAIEAVLSGIEKARKDCEIVVGLILCMMTYPDLESNHAENLETIRQAQQFYGKGVVAVDIAGYEATHHLPHYADCFRLAKEAGLPYTIHAGESGPAINVEDALALGAKRIGHGGHCLEDTRVLQLVKEADATLEMCITSNVQCKNQPSYQKHAIRRLFDEGVKVTINTDNMTLSDTDLDQEIEKVKKYLGFTDEMVYECTLNSLNAAFVDDITREKLIHKLRRSYGK